MRLSHAETQALISARLDGPLDPVAERELNAHLATCDSCRAFSVSAAQLARGLQALPYLPASPAVTRAVLDHVSTPRSPWSWLAGSLPANALPAASAIAAAVIIVFVGSFAAFQFLDDSDEPSAIPASTLELAQGSTQTAETPVEPTEPDTTFVVATNAVERQAAITEEPAVATDDPAEANPAEASDAPTTESAPGGEIEIGPPQTRTPGTTDRLQPATDEPEVEPTAEPTTVPTDVPTVEPAPTDAPTVENTPDPSQNIRRLLGLETAVPTDTPTTEPAAQPTPTPEPTPEPTEEPTATPTVEPTLEPTAAPTIEPTAEPTPIPTPEPTAEPTPVPTDEPIAEPSPTVVPIIPREEEAAESDGAREADEPAADDEPEVGTDDNGSGDDAANQTVGPSGIDQSIVDPDAADGSGSDDATPESGQIIQGIEEAGEDGDDGDDVQVIEPSGGEDAGTEPDDDTDDGSDDENNGLGESDQDENQGSGGASLGEAEVYAQVGEIPGDPNARLGLSVDGTLIFSPAPGQVPLERNGISLETAAGDTGQVVQACANGDCVDVSAASASSPGHVDNPIGWLGDDIIYERLNGDQFAVEFRIISLDNGSLQPLRDDLIEGGDVDLERLIRPYEVDGALLTPAPAGWLRITPTSVEIVDGNPFGGDLNLIRVNPSSGQISYVASGTLILAPLTAPGSPIVQVPFSGSDYDFSPDGSRIAVVTGAGIEIWDTQGNVLATYPNAGGIALGSLSWLNDGLIFVDLSNGVLRILEP